MSFDRQTCKIHHDIHVKFGAPEKCECEDWTEEKWSKERVCDKCDDLKWNLGSYYYHQCFFCALTKGLYDDWESYDELVLRVFSVLDMVEDCIRLGIPKVEIEEVHPSMKAHYENYCRAYDLIGRKYNVYIISNEVTKKKSFLSMETLIKYVMVHFKYCSDENLSRMRNLVETKVESLPCFIESGGSKILIDRRTL